MSSPLYDFGRFWRVTPFGIFLYVNTGHKTAIRFNATKEEAIAWEAKMVAKEKEQNEGNKKAIKQAG